jgi:hypothetical protein
VTPDKLARAELHIAAGLNVREAAARIISPGAAAIHADRNLLAVQDAGERHSGKLAALICVEYL